MAAVPSLHTTLRLGLQWAVCVQLSSHPAGGTGKGQTVVPGDTQGGDSLPWLAGQKKLAGVAGECKGARRPSIPTTPFLNLFANLPWLSRLGGHRALPWGPWGSRQTAGQRLSHHSLVCFFLLSVKPRSLMSPGGEVTKTQTAKMPIGETEAAGFSEARSCPKTPTGREGLDILSHRWGHQQNGVSGAE